MRNVSTTLVLLGLATALLFPACHRRRRAAGNGVCAAHIDCSPGYDCLDRRCAKRAPFPGSRPEPPAASPVAPATPAPWGTPAKDEVPAPAPAKARPPEVTPPTPDPSLPSSTPPSYVPMWKARLKNS